MSQKENVFHERPVWLLEPKKVDMLDLKSGDLFRMEKANENDPENLNCIFLATSDGEKTERQGERQIYAVRFMEVKEQ